MRPRSSVVMSTTRGFGDALRSPQPPLTLGNLSRSEQVVTALVAVLPATASSLGLVAHNLGLALPGAARRASTRLADPVLLVGAIGWLLLLWALRLGRRVQKQSRSLCTAAEAAVEGSRFSEIEGVDVHYVECSRAAPATPAAVPLLLHLNHGFGANALTWDTFMEPLTAALSARGQGEVPIRVVAHDRLGFGLSGRPTQLYKYGESFQAAVALQLLGAAPSASGATPVQAPAAVANATATAAPAALAPASPPPLTPTILVGHSIGSILSATMAVQQGGSGHVRGLVLIAPAILAGPTRAAGSQPVPSVGIAAAARAAGAMSARLTRASMRGLLGLLTPLLRVLLQLLIAQPGFWSQGIGSAYGDPKKLAPSMVLRYRWPVQVKGSSEGLLRFVRAQLLEPGRAAEKSGGAVDRARGGQGQGGGGTGTGTAATGSATATAATGTAAAEPPLWEALQALGLPVLIIHGAKDKLVPLSNSRRLAASMPTASLLELPESGHCPHEESPEEVCRAVCDWVAGLGLLAGARQ